MNHNLIPEEHAHAVDCYRFHLTIPLTFGWSHFDAAPQKAPNVSYTGAHFAIRHVEVRRVPRSSREGLDCATQLQLCV